jgi:hypothetical protein
MTQDESEDKATPFQIYEIPTEEQRRADDEQREREFGTRTAGLRKAAELLNTGEAAIRQYRNTPRLLCIHLNQVYEMLKGTLDGPTDRVPYNRESREWILQTSRTVLAACQRVFKALAMAGIQVPVDQSRLQRIVDDLSMILDPEGDNNNEFHERQYLREENLATYGLDGLWEELDTFNMWCVIKSDEVELPEVAGIETNAFVSGPAGPGDVPVVSNTANTDDKKVPPRVPRWDQETRILYFGVEERRFAPQILHGVIPKILNSFEEERWPNRIFNPVSQSQCEMLTQALRTLNKDNGLGIRFQKDGDGIKWSENPLPKSP